MRGTSSIRFLVASGAAAAMVTLAGCEQQAHGEGDLAVASASAALTQDQVIPAGGACTPTGKHDQHARANVACTACHQCAGTLSFDTSIAGANAAFDATTKNCSNVSCHSVPTGTFSYYFPGGDGEPVLNTVPYGGTPGTGALNWYDAQAGSCTACHGNPPRTYTWHSGYHGGQGPTGAYNQCQFCHPDATGSNGVGTGITSPSLHMNGVVNVQAKFTSACFGCH